MSAFYLSVLALHLFSAAVLLPSRFSDESLSLPRQPCGQLRHSLHLHRNLLMSGQAESCLSALHCSSFQSFATHRTTQLLSGWVVGISVSYQKGKSQLVWPMKKEYQFNCKTEGDSFILRLPRPTRSCLIDYLQSIKWARSVILGTAVLTKYTHWNYPLSIFLPLSSFCLFQVPRSIVSLFSMVFK